MWKLNKVGSSILNQYKQEMLPILYKGIVDNLPASDIAVLIPGQGTPTEDLSILEDLLMEEPNRLFALNNTLMAKLINGYRDSDLPIFQKACRKTKTRTTADVNLINTYGPVLQKLKNAIDYKGNISENAGRAYRLTEMKGANVCTYCNRQYIFTINKPKKKKGLEYIARPELDHWFCKELYPLLSLSFYNLIPSCHICNSSAKGSLVFNLTTHIHPYLQNDQNPAFKFKPTPSVDFPNHWDVIIDRVNGTREDNTIKAFALDEIYAMHGRLEVEELMKFNYSYNAGYLKILYDELLYDFCPKLSRAEVYRMLFGTELEPARFGERPMSKLKHDILEYLHII